MTTTDSVIDSPLGLASEVEHAGTSRIDITDGGCTRGRFSAIFAGSTWRERTLLEVLVELGAQHVHSNESTWYEI